MKVLFAGAEVVFIFGSNLVNSSCVRKKADNPAEMTCVPPGPCALQQPLEHIPLLLHAAKCLLYFSYIFKEDEWNERNSVSFPCGNTLPKAPLI